MEDIKSLFNFLVQLEEGEGYIEFKENFDKTRDGKNISAIANTSLLKGKDFGYIIYGVNDNKTIVGTSFVPNTEKTGNQNIKIWLSQKISPKTHIDFLEDIIEGYKIVILKVSSAIDRPVEFDGDAYIRIGESTTLLSSHPEIERKIWNNNKNRNFEKGIAGSNLSVDEVLKLLDYDKYFTLSNQNIPSEKSKFLEQMTQDNLVKNEQNGLYSITTLGATLFARDLENFTILKRKSIRVITYNGTNKVSRKNDIEGKKGYAVGFEGLIEYIITQVGNNEEITKALRVETNMYPEIALREFIANAVIHQDFSISGAGPIIEIYSNRIEITNPGIPLIDTERFIDHPPRSRNEDLASLMRRFGFCEESGSGVDRALINIEIFQLPAPKFETYDDFTKITMYAPKDLKSMSLDDKVRACYQHCVLQYLSSEEKMSNKTLRIRFNIPESNYPAASKIISATLKKGKIKSSDKSKAYIPWWA